MLLCSWVQSRESDIWHQCTRFEDVMYTAFLYNLVANLWIQMAISAQHAVLHSSTAKVTADIWKPSTPSPRSIVDKNAPTPHPSPTISNDIMLSVISGGGQRTFRVAVSPCRKKRKLLITGTTPLRQPPKNKNMLSPSLNLRLTLNRAFSKRKMNFLPRKNVFSFKPGRDVMLTKSGSKSKVDCWKSLRIVAIWAALSSLGILSTTFTAFVRS